jgi:regulator of protease activity HflC (stomatin/prohibitin superfamily)
MKVNFKTILAGVVALILLITCMVSFDDVDPGQEGFIYRPYSGGVDKEITYSEGTYFVAPWNEMITYNTLQESKTYQSSVMDKNGTDITLEVYVNFSVKKSGSSKLHLMHGTNYRQFIDDKSKGAIKNVIGRYTYEEVYSTKREALVGEIEAILKEDFTGNYIVLNYVEIADVNLPGNISRAITEKETQKQDNLKSELMKIEEKNMADAKVEKARGESEKIRIEAEGKSKAIKLLQDQIARSPAYLKYEYIKKWNGVEPKFKGGSTGGMILDMRD